MNTKEVFTLIKTRRSIRQFTEGMVNEEDLKTILEAGLYAPSAGSRQTPKFLVIKNQELILKLGKLNRAAMTIRPGGSVNSCQPSIIDNPNISNGFYDAPVLITLVGSKNSIYGSTDCAMCGQNMLLMAHALGLGACFIGRAKEVFDSDIGRAIWQQNGLSDDEQAYYHIIIGQPKGAAYCKERNPNRIIIIE